MRRMALSAGVFSGKEGAEEGVTLEAVKVEGNGMRDGENDRLEPVVLWERRRALRSSGWQPIPLFFQRCNSTARGRKGVRSSGNFSTGRRRTGRLGGVVRLNTRIFGPACGTSRSSTRKAARRRSDRRHLPKVGQALACQSAADKGSLKASRPRRPTSPKSLTKE